MVEKRRGSRTFLYIGLIIVVALIIVALILIVSRPSGIQFSQQQLGTLVPAGTAGTDTITVNFPAEGGDGIFYITVPKNKVVQDASIAIQGSES